MLRFALFVYLLHAVSSEPTIPTIIDFSSLPIKDVNESVTLSCSVKNLQSYSIAWSKQKLSGYIQISANDKKIIPDARIGVTLENTTSGITVSRLNINRVQNTDAGVYRCTVPLDLTEEVSKEITLQVRFPPVIYANTSSTIHTTINNSTKLECYSGGYPTPVVIWTRENNALLPNKKPSYEGNVLKIDNVQKEDAGNYYCSADNKVGNIVKKTFALKVEYAPTVKAEKERVEQAINFSTHLTCNIDGSPTPVITWIKDGMPITDNQYYTITQEAISDTIKAKLKIEVFESKLYGTYVCQAANRFGKKEASIDLRKSDKEVCEEGVCSSGHISFLDFKLSFTSVIILMLNWQNM